MGKFVVEYSGGIWNVVVGFVLDGGVGGVGSVF